MSRRKTLRKNYSKKANRRRNATKRKRVGGGSWFSRRAQIHPVQSVSPRLTESTSPNFQRTIDPSVANYVLNMPEHIDIIKLAAQELEQIYNNNPELFDKIRDGYMKYATEGSFLNSYHDSYARDYEAYLKLLLQKLPNKDIQHYSSEQEKRDALSTLGNIRSSSSQFLDNIKLDKKLSSKSFGEDEEKIFKHFTDMLKIIKYHSDPDHDIWKLPHT
jgi:hypothetical protein